MTAPLYRDSRGRFVSLPIAARAKLAAIGAKPPIPILRNVVKPPYVDAIYRPVHKLPWYWYTWAFLTGQRWPL
jgi:hypothetical protein